MSNPPSIAMSTLLTGFQHALILSEREELCAVERHSLRQLGLPFIQHLSDGSRALELIQKNNVASRRGLMSYPGRPGQHSGRTSAPLSSSLGRPGAVLLSSPGHGNLSSLPVDLVLCTERLEDTHSLSFIEKLRAMKFSGPGQANIALLVFPDSTRLWREAEKLGACCLSRPYTMHDLQTVLHKARHLAQKSFALHSQASAKSSGKGALAAKSPTFPKFSGESSGAQPRHSFPPQSSEAAAGRSGQSELVHKSEGLGLAKPEPPKREPFPLIDDDFYEMQSVKREPFPLVDDDDEMEASSYFNRPRRAPFSLVDDGDFVPRHISGVSADPADLSGSGFSRSSYSADRSRYSRSVNRQSASVTDSGGSFDIGRTDGGTSSSDIIEGQAVTESRHAGLEQAEQLLTLGYHINAAQAFLNVPEFALQGKSLHYVISRACQFTAAPENNLRSMGKAMDIIGHPALASMLERNLFRMYGTGTEPQVHPLFKAFPLLEDVLSVAQMTFSAWREPDDGLVGLG